MRKKSERGKKWTQMAGLWQMVFRQLHPPEKAGHTAECTSFGPEKAGRERTNEQTGTGKDTKGRGK